jgi:hypothetical protein
MKNRLPATNWRASAAGHVGVRLDPHAADGHEPTLGDAPLDPLEQLRLVLLQPGVLLGGRRGEHELVGSVDLRVHEVEDVRERPRHLPDGLAHRPQPRRVDVRVPDGVHPVRARPRRGGQHVRELGPAQLGGARHVLGVDDVDGPFEGPQHLGAPRQVGGQLGDQPGQRPDVLRELPDRHVEQPDVGGDEPVERVVARRGRVAHPGRAVRPVGRDARVGRRFHVHVDGRTRAGGEGDVGVARLDGRHHDAVRGVGEPLGLEARLHTGETEVDGELGPRSGVGPAGRHGARDVEPDRAPRPAPRRAHLERRELLPHRLGERHRLARRRPRGDLERHALAVHRGNEPFADEPRDPRYDQVRVIVHGIYPTCGVNELSRVRR